MQGEAPELLRENVQHWLYETSERRMLRTLDGNCRAFLSDRYARIDNNDVANMVMPILAEEAQAGLNVVSCEITDRRLYIKAVTTRLEADVKVGDPVQAGLVISNSEIGFGAVRVEPMLYRLVCLNGMISADSTFRKNHIGARADMSDAVYEMLSDEAIQADDHAILLKVRDVVRASLNEERFLSTVARMQEVAEFRITGDPIKAVEVLSNKVGLNQTESGDALRHLINGADLSQYGMMNAVTRLSQDVPSYDRATELEAVGGKILNLPTQEWAEIAQAA